MSRMSLSPPSVVALRWPGMSGVHTFFQTCPSRWWIGASFYHEEELINATRQQSRQNATLMNLWVRDKRIIVSTSAIYLQGCPVGSFISQHQSRMRCSSFKHRTVTRRQITEGLAGTVSAPMIRIEHGPLRRPFSQFSSYSKSFILFHHLKRYMTAPGLLGEAIKLSQPLES